MYICNAYDLNRMRFLIKLIWGNMRVSMHQYEREVAEHKRNVRFGYLLGSLFLLIIYIIFAMIYSFNTYHRVIT